MKINDKELRKISISARDLLIETRPAVGLDSASAADPAPEAKYTLNTEMVEFLRAIRNKYRVYLLTRLKSEKPGEYDTKEYEIIHELLMKLVKQDIIKGKQRLMFSASEAGHIAQIRHLAAQLHIESK